MILQMTPQILIIIAENYFLLKTFRPFVGYEVGIVNVTHPFGPVTPLYDPITRMGFRSKYDVKNEKKFCFIEFSELIFKESYFLLNYED